MVGKVVDHCAGKPGRNDIPLQTPDRVEADAHDLRHLGLGQVVTLAEIANILAKDM